MNRFDKMTLKVQDAFSSAQEMASDLNQQQVEVEHLVLALLRQREGVVPSVLRRMGISVTPLERALEEHVDGLPRVHGHGGQMYMSTRLAILLQAAAREAKALKDTYISAEHILLQVEDGQVVQAGSCESTA